MSNTKTKEKTNDEFHFEVPFDVIELPSKGLLYPGRQSTVKVEYLTASDENILTSPNLLKSGKVLDVLLERKVKDSPVPFSDLLLGDRNAIMVWLRATGYGHMYPVRLVDPATVEEFDYEVDLNTLETTSLVVEPNENNEFSFDLPVSKKTIKFRLLTVGDERQIVEKTEKRKRTTKSLISNTLTYRLERQITEVDGNRDPAFISRFIQVLPAMDSLKFREYADEIEPGIELEVDVEGPSGENFRSPVPLGLNFFWPNARV